jgi:uncharacterized membrane protein
MIGFIPLGFVNLTTMFLPVIIGTLSAGLGVGMIAGGLFGLSSFLKAIGTSPSLMSANLLAVNPIYVLIVCFVPRILIAVTTHFTYKLIAKGDNIKRRRIGIGTASAVGALTNTIFYLGLMLLFYVITGLDSIWLLAAIAGTLPGAVAEAIFSAIVCTPIVIALTKQNRLSQHSTHSK